MSELEEIKQQAAERRRPREFHAETMEAEVHRADVMEKLWGQAEADLDHAIEIAEKNLRAFEDCWSSHQAQKKELNQLSASVKRGDHLLMERYREVVEERDQARADVLKLRAHIAEDHWGCKYKGYCQLMADTEHYEQYR